MRCALCQLVYETVDQRGLCGGCADDMGEAEQLLRAAKIRCTPASMQAIDGSNDLQEQVEDPLLLCFDLDFALYEYGLLAEVTAA